MAAAGSAVDPELRRLSVAALATAVLPHLDPTVASVTRFADHLQQAVSGVIAATPKYSAPTPAHTNWVITVYYNQLQLVNETRTRCRIPPETTAIELRKNSTWLGWQAPASSFRN